MKVGELMQILKRMPEDVNVYLRSWDTRDFTEPTIIKDKHGDEWVRLDGAAHIVNDGDMATFGALTAAGEIHITE